MVTESVKAGPQVQNVGTRPIRMKHACEDEITPKENHQHMTPTPHDHDTHAQPMPARCQQAVEVDPIAAQPARTSSHVVVSETSPPRDTGASDLASLDHLTLEELATETIAFGQKYKGHQYQDTWQDQEWIQFMVSRYQNSSKEEHRRFLKYVELQVSAIEQGQGTAPVSSQTVIAPRAKPKVKPMAKSIATASGTSSPAGGKRMGHGHRDVRPTDYEPDSHAADGGHGSCPTTIAAHGECHDQSHPVHREQGEPHESHAGGGRGLVREDWSDDVLTTMHHETSKVFQMVNEFPESCNKPERYQATRN